MTPGGTFYEILSIPADASAQSIKRAFRRLAQRLHPDHDPAPEAQIRFRLLREAYETLIEAGRREKYDAWLTNGRAFIRRAANVPARPALAPAPDGRFGTLDAVFAHLNFLLWEIEDLVGENKRVVSAPPECGAFVSGPLLEILIFIDRWILHPAEYPDYFFEARGVKPPQAYAYFTDLRRRLEANDGSYGAYAGLKDYFYQVRRRFDEFLRHIRPSELDRRIPEHGVSILDSVFEAQRLALHNLFHLKRLQAGEIAGLPAYQFSSPVFRK